MRSGGSVDPFFNVNTPQDVAQAKRSRLRWRTPRHDTRVRRNRWKKSGKTTLLTRLVTEFTRRRYRVSTVKHAHHDFDIDKPATDSYRHRESGAAK